MKFLATIRNFLSSKPVVFALVVFGIKLLQLVQLYFTQTPSGGSFVERPMSGFICAAIVNLAACAFLGILFALASLLKGKASSITCAVVSSLAWFHLLICAINDHIMRWMGQHLTMSFLSTYSVSRMDPAMTLNIAKDGLGSFMLSTFIMLLAGALLVFLNIAPLKRLPRIAFTRLSAIPTAIFVCILAVLMVASGNAHNNFKPCHIRWQIIQPPYATLFEEYLYMRAHRVKPERYEQGISMLGGNAQSEYPFYHRVENEDSLMDAFRNKPLEQKKDIILLSLESFRGWVGDFRIGSNCKRMPNLCALSKSGTTFPYTYSVGYPSTEGMLGLQLGIWGHPNKVFLSSMMNTRARSLPDILGKAGYYRAVLTAAEPSFDNFMPWFEKWFDYAEYNPKVTTDIPLANRFKELYANAPKDKPLYFEWINFVTHTPFNVPESYAKPAKTSDERYAQAVAYLDSAIGIILDAVRKGPRANETVIVVTGDHSIANAKAQKKLGELGEANSTYTWTTFIWAGAGISEGTIVETPVSHVDYAPSILSLIGLNATNSFVGKDLFDADNPRQGKVFSFRHADAVMREDSLAIFAQAGNREFSHARRQSTTVDWDTTETVGGFIAEEKAERDVSAQADSLLDAMDSWIWVLDHNLLVPEE